jgi:hypothetical protein
VFLLPCAVSNKESHTRCIEPLFDPAGFLGRDTIIAGVHWFMLLEYPLGSNLKGISMHVLISSMVMESIRCCPIDLTKPMYGNIILAGGTTMLPGLYELHNR